MDLFTSVTLVCINSALNTSVGIKLPSTTLIYLTFTHLYFLTAFVSCAVEIGNLSAYHVKILC